jgi:hypothetical protein
MFGEYEDIKRYHSEPEIDVMDRLLIDSLLPKLFLNNTLRHDYENLLYGSKIYVSAESSDKNKIREGFYLNPLKRSNKDIKYFTRVATPGEVLLFICLSAKGKAKNDYISKQRTMWNEWIQARKLVEASDGSKSWNPPSPVFNLHKSSKRSMMVLLPGYEDDLPTTPAITVKMDVDSKPPQEGDSVAVEVTTESKCSVPMLKNNLKPLTPSHTGILTQNAQVLLHNQSRTLENSYFSATDNYGKNILNENEAVCLKLMDHKEDECNRLLDKSTELFASTSKLVANYNHQSIWAQLVELAAGSKVFGIGVNKLDHTKLLILSFGHWALLENMFKNSLNDVIGSLVETIGTALALCYIKTPSSSVWHPLMETLFPETGDRFMKAKKGLEIEDQLTLLCSRASFVKSRASTAISIMLSSLLRLLDEPIHVTASDTLSAWLRSLGYKDKYVNSLAIEEKVVAYLALECTNSINLGIPSKLLASLLCNIIKFRHSYITCEAFWSSTASFIATPYSSKALIEKFGLPPLSKPLVANQVLDDPVTTGTLDEQLATQPPTQISPLQASRNSHLLSPPPSDKRPRKKLKKNDK